MNRQVAQALVGLSIAVMSVGFSGSVSAKKPPPPPPAPSTPSFYFVDSSNPPKVIGKALSVTYKFDLVGLALVPVVAPSGHQATILLDVAGMQFSPFSNSIVFFESQDCSGTPYIYSVPNQSGALAGAGPAYAIVQSPIPNPSAAFLFVATQTSPQQFESQSYANEVALGLTGYELNCVTVAQQPGPVLPAEFYGNLFNTYHPPFDVVVP